MGGMKTDDQLLQGALRGCSEDFGTLAERYYRVVYGIAFSYTGNPSDAEDLTQESFLKAYRSLDTLRDIARFRAWILRIVRNECHNWWARHTCEQSAVESKPADSVVVTSDAERKELFDFLWREIAGLSEPSREILTTYYFHGKSTRELALQLGISVSAVEKRLQRARQMLGERMALRLDDALEPHRPSDSNVKRVTQAVIAVPVAWDNARVSVLLGTAQSASNTISVAIVATLLIGVLGAATLMAYNKYSARALVPYEPILEPTEEESPGNPEASGKGVRAEAPRTSDVRGRPDFTVRVVSEDPPQMPVPNAHVTVVSLQRDALTATTDANGLAEFPHSPLAHLGLTVAHPAYVKRRLGHMLIARGGSVDVVLAKGPPIAGHVLDGLTGEPIPEFELELSGVEPFRSEPWEDGPVTFQHPDGYFKITNITNALSVSARAPGFARAEIPLTPGVDRAAIAIPLVRPISVEGRVTDTQGNAIAGAVIGLVRNGMWLNHTRDFELSNEVATNEHGEYHLERTDPLDTVLVAIHAGFVPHMSALDEELSPGNRIRRDIELMKTAKVQGIVRYDGVPYEGATVHAGGRSPRPAKSDASGSFVLDDLEPGSTTVVAVLSTAPGIERRELIAGQLLMLNESDDQSVQFDFTRSTSAIVGSVVVESDVVETYNSRIIAEISGAAGIDRRSDYVQGKELFVFEDIPSGSANLFVETTTGDGVRHLRSLVVNVPPDREVVQDIEILLPTGSVIGRIHGIPLIHEAHVTLLEDAHQVGRDTLRAVLKGTANLQEDGEFRFHGLEAGSFTVLVTTAVRSPATRGAPYGNRLPWFDLADDRVTTNEYHLDQYDDFRVEEVLVAAGDVTEMDIHLETQPGS